MTPDILVNTWRSAIDAIAPIYDAWVARMGDDWPRPVLAEEAALEDRFMAAYKANNLPEAMKVIEQWRRRWKEVLG